MCSFPCFWCVCLGRVLALTLGFLCHGRASSCLFPRVRTGGMGRYVDVLQPTSIRSQLLSDHYFFECACRRCCPEDVRTYGSKRRRRSHFPAPASGPGGTNGKHEQVASSAAGGRGHASFRALCSGAGGKERRDDLVAGGWVCQKRACCRRGRILRPTGRRAGEERDQDHDRQVSNPKLLDSMPNGVPRGAVLASGPSLIAAACQTCGDHTEEAYFEHWEGIMRGALMVADGDFLSGRTLQGMKRLAGLLVSDTC